jgi:hypothetical protein
MLSTILVGHLLPALHVLFHGRVNDQLLGEGVAGQLPDELVLPSGLLVVVLGVEDVVVVLL